MNFLDKTGLGTLLNLLENIFGHSKKALEEQEATRQKYLLEIDYDKELAFNTDFLVGDNSPYVGSAVVGQTYVA